MKTPLFASLFLAAAVVANAATPEECLRAKKLGKTEQAATCLLELSRSDNAWYRAEAAWASGRFDEARNLFQQALSANPGSAEIRVRSGRLYLERFNKSEASKLFGEALKINEKDAGALMGMALLSAEGFSSKAEDYAKKAAEADPKRLDARELLARLALERSRPDEARKHAQQALAMSPDGAIDAMAVLATADWLEDKKTSPWEQKALAINPNYSELYGIGGDIFVLQRRYREAIALYEKAVALEGHNYRVRSELGVNLMRLGRDQDARKQLETAYEAGYRNAATVNTLRLLDSYSRFDVVRDGNLSLRLRKDEADLLRIYAMRELKKAVSTYNKKYRFELKEPLQVEFYPDHEDFAVRTMGLPGLGALGVAFGDAVAMDSPAARPPGQFHWASTLWHELSHIYLMKMTDHKVPRWFTEGVSVHEEMQVSKEWGDRLDPPILKAIRDKTLLPIADLDRGFQQPDTPTQVVVSYFQAGRVIDFITEKRGWDTILQMIGDFKQMKTTAEVIPARMGISPEEFDKQFLEWLDADVGQMARNFPEWEKTMKPLVTAFEERNWDKVIADGPRVRDLYPEYVDKRSVYEMLAEAYRAKGNSDKATEEMLRYVRKGGRSPELIKSLATLLVDAGRNTDAAGVLERLNFIYPQDAALHQQLGDLYATLGNKQGALTEFHALVAMKPIDMAGAHYRLATAYKATNQPQKALDEVYLALELAPGFKDAQKLLLELSP